MVLHAVAAVAEQDDVLVLVGPGVERRHGQQRPALRVVDQLDDGLDGRAVVLVVGAELVDGNVLHLRHQVVLAERGHDVELLAPAERVRQDVAVGPRPHVHGVCEDRSRLGRLVEDLVDAQHAAVRGHFGGCAGLGVREEVPSDRRLHAVRADDQVEGVGCAGRGGDGRRRLGVGERVDARAHEDLDAVPSRRLGQPRV